jgi:hypothetical protein
MKGKKLTTTFACISLALVITFGYLLGLGIAQSYDTINSEQFTQFSLLQLPLLFNSPKTFKSKSSI